MNTTQLDKLPLSPADHWQEPGGVLAFPQVGETGDLFADIDTLI